MATTYTATATPQLKYTSSGVTSDYTLNIGGMQNYIQNISSGCWDTGTSDITTISASLVSQRYGTDFSFVKSISMTPVHTDVATNTTRISIYNDLNITIGNYGIYSGGYGPVSNGSYIDVGYAPLTPKDMKRSLIRSRMTILVKSRACPISGVPQAEQMALETLREMISESDFRRYLKYGFLMVRGSSGDMFQVYRQAWKTKVYRDGELIEEVCVRIKDSNVPPTDNVIAFKTIIESDDEAFRAMGNRFKVQRVGNFTISEQNMYQIAA